MNPASSPRGPRLRAAALSAALALAFVAAAFAQALPPDKSISVYVPENTGKGDWPGTYFYSCRDFKLALWIRSREGLPEIKARYLSLQTPESFETDWNGDASYYFSGEPGTFALHLGERGEREIEGTWRWDLQLPTSGRSENGTFSLYRAGRGRALVMKFDKLDRVERSGDKIRRMSLSSVVWTFWKYSKRTDVLWEELPI